MIFSLVMSLTSNVWTLLLRPWLLQHITLSAGITVFPKNNHGLLMQPHKNMISNLNLAISDSKNILPNANTVINLAMLPNNVLSYTPGKLQPTAPLPPKVQTSDGSLICYIT
jgi:hypothetical protein